MAKGEVITIDEEVVRKVHNAVVKLTLTGNEARYLLWLLGKCNGPVTAPNTTIYRALEQVFEGRPDPGVNFDPKFEVPTIQVVTTKWYDIRGDESDVF